jgi:hypothetical protein
MPAVERAVLRAVSTAMTFVLAWRGIRAGAGVGPSDQRASGGRRQ